MTSYLMPRRIGHVNRERDEPGVIRTRAELHIGTRRGLIAVFHIVIMMMLQIGRDLETVPYQFCYHPQVSCSNEQSTACNSRPILCTSQSHVDVGAPLIEK